MVEGARLESVYTGNRIVGSNPTFTASSTRFRPDLWAGAVRPFTSHPVCFRSQSCPLIRAATSTRYSDPMRRSARPRKTVAADPSAAEGFDLPKRKHPLHAGPVAPQPARSAAERVALEARMGAARGDWACPRGSPQLACDGPFPVAREHALACPGYLGGSA